MDGAREVQTLLERHPEARLGVVAVWMPMLITDSPRRIERVLHDPRVTNRWEPDKATSRRFAERLRGRRGLFLLGGVLWDSYVLLDAEGRIVDVGGPVTFHLDRLSRSLSELAR